MQRAGIARRQSGVLGKQFFTTSATCMRGPGIFSARCVIIVTGFWLIFLESAVYPHHRSDQHGPCACGG